MKPTIQSIFKNLISFNNTKNRIRGEIFEREVIRNLKLLLEKLHKQFSSVKSFRKDSSEIFSNLDSQSGYNGNNNHGNNEQNNDHDLVESFRKDSRKNYLNFDLQPDNRHNYNGDNNHSDSDKQSNDHNLVEFDNN